MIKPILKYINSIPFPLTIKHYQTFGYSTSFFKDKKLDSSQSWDALRTTHPQFSISSNRKEWLLASEAQVRKDGQDGGLSKRAEDVNKLLQRENIKTLFSVGVGGAGLEYQIKKINPNINLICSEYAPTNVELLKNVFTEADEIIEYDILGGNWKDVKRKYFNNDDYAVLMYRVDASFNDKEWRRIFVRLYASGVKRVIFIPSSFLTLLSIFNRKVREFKWKRSKTEVVFSGFLRTRSRFRSYWRDLYSDEQMEFGGIKGFLLTIK